MFRRVGNHLLVNHVINLQQALCGFKLPIEHLDGRMLEVNVPAGQVIDPRFAWTVHREGMPLKNSGGVERGNLVIYFEVRFPESLPPKQLAQVAEALDFKAAEPASPGAKKCKLSPWAPKPKQRGGRYARHEEEEDEEEAYARARGGGGGGGRMPGGAQQVNCQQQ